jgi:hypothetical protein
VLLGRVEREGVGGAAAIALRRDDGDLAEGGKSLCHRGKSRGDVAFVVREQYANEFSAKV